MLKMQLSGHKGKYTSRHVHYVV